MIAEVEVAEPGSSGDWEGLVAAPPGSGLLVVRLSTTSLTGRRHREPPSELLGLPLLGVSSWLPLDSGGVWGKGGVPM